MHIREEMICRPKKNSTRGGKKKGTTSLEMCNTHYNVVLWPGISSTYVNKMSVH